RKAKLVNLPKKRRNAKYEARIDRSASISIWMALGSILLPVIWLFVVGVLTQGAPPGSIPTDQLALLTLLPALFLCVASWMGSLWFAAKALWRREPGATPSKGNMISVQILVGLVNLGQFLIYVFLVGPIVFPV